MIEPTTSKRRQRPTTGRVTIDDVANRAGVSIKTVSRVLNDEPNVRPATRARVEQAVRELDYSPNPSARGLAGTRSRMIGLIYVNPSPNYLFQAISGVLQGCEAAGYGLSLQAPEPDDPGLADNITRFVRQSRVDGVLLIPPIGDVTAVLDSLEEIGMPYARIAPLDGRPGVGVSVDDRLASSRVVEHLVGLGHTRIGFIEGHPAHGASHARLEGYRLGLARAELAFEPELVVSGRFDAESGRRAAAHFLGMKNPPTAIFASNDEMAAGLMQVALKQQWPIPERISVAGFDDTPLSRNIWPSLTTVRQPIRPMALRATELLLDLIDQRGEAQAAADASRIELFEAPLIVRATTGPVAR